MRRLWPCRRSARAFVARVLVAALLLPAAFSLSSPDPHWFLGVGSATEHHQHPEGTSEHDHSEIPGSPGHPAGHDCSPCQVLKYLAIYLPQLPFFLPAAAPAVFAAPARD